MFGLRSVQVTETRETTEGEGLLNTHLNLRGERWGQWGRRSEVLRLGQPPDPLGCGRLGETQLLRFWGVLLVDSSATSNHALPFISDVRTLLGPTE